jgi:hypothetical protein
MAKESGLSLSELIKSISEELRNARTDPDSAVIQLDKCELELAVSVKGEASGGIKFWVLNAGAKVSGETVSKVKVSFVPVEGKPAPAMKVTPQDGIGVKHGRKA